jgi:REP element-mobilizing transposase RayT
MNRYNPDRHQRRSIRLQRYDYTQAGAYFVTLCTYQRACIFGDVVDGTVHLNVCGQIAEEEWLKTPFIRPGLELDAFALMPNHLHGIVMYTTDAVRAHSCAPVPPLHRKPRSLGAFVSGYKSAVTKRINYVRGTSGQLVWQRNYYEHVIRSEQVLRAIRQYIVDNPARWHLDRYNPLATEHDPQAQALWTMLHTEATDVT